jgi:hypothetical protein
MPKILRLIIPLACKQIIAYLYVQPSSWGWPLDFRDITERRTYGLTGNLLQNTYPTVHRTAHLRYMLHSNLGHKHVLFMNDMTVLRPISLKFSWTIPRLPSSTPPLPPFPPTPTHTGRRRRHPKIHTKIWQIFCVYQGCVFPLKIGAARRVRTQ